MTNGPSRVCVVGSVNIDTTYRVPQIPTLGETVLATDRTVAPGGKGANQAVVAASLGSRVSMLGCVGDDAEAGIATASLIDRGVDVSQLVRIGNALTGTAVLLVDDAGENVIVVEPGANLRVDPGVVAAHLASTDYDVVLAQLEISLPAVVSAARNSGRATFILNPAPMPRDDMMLRDILEHTDVLVPNRPELARLAGRPLPVTRGELDRCVASLDFDGIVLVTLGSAGVAVYDRGPARRSTYIDAVRVESVDTTGAGDTFCGVLGHFIAQHGDVVRAAHQANEVAAWSTTVWGAQAPPELLRVAALSRASSPSR